MRVSVFQRYLRELDEGAAAGANGPASLSPSLLQDLMRFERNDSAGRDLLQVLAACIRHARNVQLHLRSEGRVLPLTVFPVDRLAHCPLPVEALLALPMQDLDVLHVEPAVLRPPGDQERLLVAEAELYAPLGPLMWQLAMLSAREDLLPEIAGNVAYRVSPAVNLRALQLGGTMAAAVARLQRQTTNLREIADWPGFDRARATRMLNGLYLQAGLIVSRTHPAATNEGWFGGKA